MYIIDKNSSTHNSNKSITLQSSVVGILLSRTPSMISVIYNAYKNHITYVPLVPSLPDERITQIIKDSGLDCIITNEKHKNRISCCNVVVVAADDAVCFEQSKMQNDVAYILYTSGSTGCPKGVAVTYKALDNLIEGISSVIDFSEGKRIASFTSVSFDIFFLETILALEKGLTVILADDEEQKNPKLMANVISDNNVDMIQMTPSRMQMLINYDPELKCLESVSEIMIGGEPFPLPMLKLLQEKTTAKIYNMYGPTETTVWSTVSDLTNKDHIDIGKPILNTQIYILDENMKEVPYGEKGEICIAGYGLAKGYVNASELTAKRFACLPNDPNVRVYKTGDIGRYLPDGNLECSGRNDNQVKIRGHRVELEEIEFCANQFEDVIQSTARLNSDGEDKYIEIYYTSEKDIDSNQLKQFLSLKLPAHMVPVKYSRVKDFVYTINDKIDRNRLNETEILSEKQENAKIQELTEIQQKIFENIISKIEDKSVITNVQADLSEAGLDSVTFIGIVVSLEAAYDFEFDDDKLLMTEFPTLLSLIEYVESKTNVK